MGKYSWNFIQWWCHSHMHWIPVFPFFLFEKSNFIWNWSFCISAHFILYMYMYNDDLAHKNVNYPIHNNYKRIFFFWMKKREKMKNFHFFWDTHTISKGFLVLLLLLLYFYNKQTVCFKSQRSFYTLSKMLQLNFY